MSHAEGQRQNSQLRLVFAMGSDPGITRKQKPNEDSLFAYQCIQTYTSQVQSFGVFVVADGMGGHAHGQEASRMAIQVISNNLLPPLLANANVGEDGLSSLLVNTIQLANRAIYQYNQQENANMGTTVTAVLFEGTTAYVANVGDSRTYLYRESTGLSQITIDHSVVARLVQTGKITSDDVYMHPKRNQLSRNLGEKADVEVDAFTVPLLTGDRLLLCSDGLWEMVRDPDIQRIMSANVEISQVVMLLIQAALAGGGNDNVSIVVVYVV
ncbi:MAG TPA: protein phosphatase 2C domain-containing protein [Ktedonobacteraceae bacterium]